MASWLEQQIAALQAQGIDVSPEALAAQIPQGYDQMPQHPAASPQPAAPQPSIWGGALTGAARDGLVGGLVGTFANPNAQAPQGEANAYQAVTGILRNVGRAIGSAYGNPNFALHARQVDQQGQQDQVQNLMGLARLQQLQQTSDLRQQEFIRRQQKETILREAAKGLDLSTDAGRKEAAARFAAIGEHDFALRMLALNKKKGPEFHSVTSGDQTVSGAYDPETNTITPAQIAGEGTAQGPRSIARGRVAAGQKAAKPEKIDAAAENAYGLFEDWKRQPGNEGLTFSDWAATDGKGLSAHALRSKRFNKPAGASAPAGAPGEAPLGTPPDVRELPADPSKLESGKKYRLPDGRIGAFNGKGFEIVGAM